MQQHLQSIWLTFPPHFLVTWHLPWGVLTMRLVPVDTVTEDPKKPFIMNEVRIPKVKMVATADFALARWPRPSMANSPMHLLKALPS